MKKRVCVVIPCYNEAAVVGKVVRDIREALNKSDYIYEVVVVDDTSSDGSPIKAGEAGATVISHLLNQGAGGATSTGLLYAERQGFDCAATMDADGQHDAADVLKCIKFAFESKIDLVIGSRLIDTCGMSRVKIIGNKGLSCITWLLFGVNVSDSQSGLRVFSKKSLDILEWRTVGYEFCSEMLWRASQAKLKIAECPIKAIYTEYSKSKGQNNWNAFNIVKSLFIRRIVEILE